MIDSTNRNTALASALVEELARCGVSRAVASPGSRSSPLTLALDREPGIALDLVLDEREAGFLALGAALESGRPVLVACTSGSAAANLYPSIVEADQAGVALLVLTSDRPPELRGIGAGQTIDQIKLYGGAVRWFSEVGTHEADDAGLLHYRSIGCRAWAEAVGGRGPVHLNLSWRDPLGPQERPGDVSAGDQLALEGRPGGRPLTVFSAGRQPDAGLVGALTDAIAAHENGLIVVGRQLQPEIAPVLAGLAERSGYPILAEPTSQLRYGAHDRSAVVAAYDLICRAPHDRLEPDLVIRFGDMPTSKALRSWLSTPGGPEQVVVDPPGPWNEPSRRAATLLQADPLSLATAVSERLDRRSASSFGRVWTEAEDAAQEAIERVLDAEDAAGEPGILRGLGRQLADGEQVLLASSMPVRDAEAFMSGGAQDVRFFSNRGANGIDGLVSTTAGLALDSDRPTWGVLGDLALAHGLGGLANLTLARSPVRLVVIDNGGGRIFEFLPQATQVERERFERLFITPSGLDLERAAELFGVAYVRADSAAGLAAARDHERVLIHIAVDPAANVDLHGRLAAAVAAAI